MTTARMRWPGLNRRSPSVRGLVADWPMWEGPGSGTIGDLVNPDPKVLRGALAGGMDPKTAWVSGPSGGYALEFNGLNNYVDCGSDSSLQVSGAQSIALWYKSLSVPTAGDEGIAGNSIGGGFQITHHVAPGRVYAYVGSGSNWLRSDAWADTDWHHIVFTWDGTTDTNGMKLYIDGSLVAQATSSVGSISPSQPFLIGKYESKFRHASFSDVKFYNQALSSLEIRHQFENPNDLLTLAPRILFATGVLDRYWVGTGAWSDAAKWSASSGGAGGAGVPIESNPVILDGGGTGNCTLTAGASAASISAVAGYTGNFDAAAFNVAVGDVTLAGVGEWDMGSGTWTVSGSFDHSAVSANGTFIAGTATLVMTGTAKTIKWGSDLPSLTTQSGATIAVHADSVIRCDVARSFVVDGELSIPSGKTLRRPFANQSDLVFGASGSLTGAGAYLAWHSGLDNSAGGTCDVATLTLLIIGSGAQTKTIVGTIASAEVILSTNAGAGGTHTWRMQDVTFGGNVTYQADGLGTLAVDNATHNPNTTYQGDVTRTPGSGAITWAKGTGTITLSGSSAQAVDFDFGSTVEDIVVNVTGTVTLTGDVATDSFTGTAGTFDPNGQTVESTGACTWSSGFDFVADADAMNGCSWIVGGNFSADSQTMNATASWLLTVSGATAVATGVTVEFSDASAGTEINASDGTNTDGGDNSNWLFVVVATILPHINSAYIRING